MATSNLTSPRLDFQFVTPNRTLTEHGYAVIYALIQRVGGINSETLDPIYIAQTLDALQFAPASQPQLPFPDDLTPASREPLPQADDVAPLALVFMPVGDWEAINARLASLEAEHTATRAQVLGLQQGYQL